MASPLEQLPETQNHSFRVASKNNPQPKLTISWVSDPIDCLNDQAILQAEDSITPARVTPQKRGEAMESKSMSNVLGHGTRKQPIAGAHIKLECKVRQ